MRHKAIAFVTLIAFTLSSCASFQTRVANVDLNRGTSALNKGDYATAEKKLKEAVYEGHLDRIDVGWNNLAFVYDKTGRPTEATAAFTMAARFGALNSAIMLNNRGERVPNPDLVTKSPPVAIGFTPGQTYFQNGVSAASASNWVEAEKQYRLAIITGQEVASAWNNLGVIYSRLPARKELAWFCYEMGAHYGSDVAGKNLVAMGRPVPSHDLETREQKDAKAAQDKAYAEARKAEEQRQAAADSSQFGNNVGEVLLVLLGAAAIGAGAYYAGKAGARPPTMPLTPYAAQGPQRAPIAPTSAGFGLTQPGCRCVCIEGKMESLCQNAIDLKPICGAQVCPFAAIGFRPPQPPMVPPIGTRSCQQEQVLNSKTGFYEWQSVCR